MSLNPAMFALSVANPGLLPLALSGGGAVGYGSSHPTTRGPVILAVVGGAVFSGLSLAGYLVSGPVGALAGPALWLTCAWCLLWGWLATQCIDHGTSRSGLHSGVYLVAYFLAATVTLVSAIGGLFLSAALVFAGAA